MKVNRVLHVIHSLLDSKMTCRNQVQVIKEVKILACLRAYGGGVNKFTDQVCRIVDVRWLITISNEDPYSMTATWPITEEMETDWTCS